MSKIEADIEVIQYPIFSRFDEVLHFTSTRTGGVSTGNYASLNLGRFSGDTQENIQENFSRFCQTIGISKNQLHLPYQTHEYKALTIDENFISQSMDIQQEYLHAVDAVVTNLPNQCIGVSTADCVPILMFDPVQKVVAAAHAGWRGTCSRIGLHTVQTMQKNFGTNPQDVVVAIGASISPDVYEVGDELIGFFQKENFDTDKIFFKKGEKYHLDLWTANKIVLMEAGVKAENIEISGLCTFTQQEKFFSARRLGIKSGRIVSGVMLKTEDRCRMTEV